MEMFLLLLSSACLGLLVWNLTNHLSARLSSYRQNIRLQALLKGRSPSVPFKAAVQWLVQKENLLLKRPLFRKYDVFLSNLIRRAALEGLRPVEVLGYQALGALGGSVVLGGLSGSLELTLITFAVGAALPVIWLRDQALRRERFLLRELPNSLEVLSLCSEAGLSVEQGIEHYLESAKASPLRAEFGRVLEQARAGSSRKEALEAMSARLELTDVALFTTSLTHAERFGLGISATLRQLAGILREKQFQRAEKTIQELPVRLLIPLVLFIMPVTFIIIFGPIALQFLK